MTPAASATGNFQGLGVAAFESRRAAEIATLISRHGGIPRVAPSMQEVPLAPNDAAMRFGEALIAGELDAVIFMTGVGVTMLLQALDTRYAVRDVIAALSRTRVVARGSKTVRALGDAGVPIAVKVPEPNTWREVLNALGDSPDGISPKGERIALQEHGAPNDTLVAGLEERGARVLRVPVYRWAMPEDLNPLEGVLCEIINARIRVALFTNAVQADHLMVLAAQKECELELRAALRGCVVCSIGPTCTEALKAHDLAVDIEPDVHKMGTLVHEASRRAPALLNKKQQRGSAAGSSCAPVAYPAVVARTAEAKDKFALPPWEASRFMKACRLEPVDATPVWMMRQAGRYMKEYRDLRARTPFLELCKNPDMVAEVTVSAAHRLGADAAILFADLLLVAEPMGFSLDYDHSGGPWVTPALRTPAQIDALPALEARDSLAYVFDAVRRARASLDARIPLVGFAGAPFTLASYLVEGGASKTFRRTKALMFSDPDAWRALMAYLVRVLTAYINGQIEAGAQAVQIFDSWVGCLSPGDYREFVLPHMQSLFRGLTPGSPIIHFGTGTGQLLEMMREAGGDIIGLDYRVELDDAWNRLGAGVGVQGNLDPAVLYANVSTIRERAVRILRQAAGRPGHIFNLGHGVLPETPVEHAADLVKIVHEESARMKLAKEQG